MRGPHGERAEDEPHAEVGSESPTRGRGDGGTEDKPHAEVGGESSTRGGWGRGRRRPRRERARSGFREKAAFFVGGVRGVFHQKVTRFGAA
jgi:hypothetical protein